MSTKKVRPILIDSKKSIITLKNNHLFYGLGDPHKDYWVQDKQLILISLEDEKIEAGSKYLEKGEIQEDFGEHKLAEMLKEKSTCEKVIATQDQLSPELIQQLIVEYNNGGMKDFEIEMVIMNKGYNKPEDYPYQEIDIPKLTNGYITVVNKQPISYSEEEVRELLKKVLTEEPEEPDQIPAKYFWEWFNIWFEINKKK